MSWTDLNADDVAKVSYVKPKKSRKAIEQPPRLKIVREPGTPAIQVRTNVPMDGLGKKVLFLRAPARLHQRIDRLVVGPKNTALVAIIEDALDRLEAGQSAWRVIAVDSKGQSEEP